LRPGNPAAWHNSDVNLVGSNGNGLKLSVIGYQFPDAEDLSQRYSWHMIGGTATHGAASWHFRWQALTCDESPRLGTWLRTLAESLTSQPPSDRQFPSRRSFSEPNLAFSVVQIADAALLRVEFDLEFHRDRAHWRVGDPYLVDIDVTSRQLTEAADQWDDDVARNPGRDSSV
jgi:hypothetical protein